MRTKINYNRNGEKQCTKCQVFKNTSEFHKWSKGQDGLKLRCKNCVREYDLNENDSKRKNPRKYVNGKVCCHECNNYFDTNNFTLRKGTMIRCNPCTIIHQHKKTVKKHGITYDQYLEMYEAQNGKCKICDGIETSHRSRLSIDHDHSCCPGETSCGQCIRGLLCFNCNTALGNAKDNIENLQKMIDYLK
jgi:hypothetical protein